MLTDGVVIAADGLCKRDVFRKSPQQQWEEILSSSLISCRFSRSIRRRDYQWRADEDNRRHQEDLESLLE